MVENKIKRVKVLIDLKKYEAAQQEVEKILKDDPFRVQVRAYELIIRQHLGSLEQRQQKIDNFLVDFPDNPFGYYMKSSFLLKRYQFKESKKMIEKALEFNPSNPEYLSQLAIVYYNLRKYKKAKEIIELSIAKDPDDFDANYFRSLINQELGSTRAKKVRNEEKSLLEIDYNTRSILYESEKLMHQKRFEESVRILRQGIFDFPIDEEIRENFILYKALSAPIIKYFYILTKHHYMEGDPTSNSSIRIFGCIFGYLLLRYIFFPILISVFFLKLHYKKQLKDGEI